MPKTKNYNKRWDPDQSQYQAIVVLKYVRQGYSFRTANKKAQKEYFDSLKRGNLFI